MRLNHSQETQDLVSQVIDAIIESCGRLPRTEIVLAHVFNHFEAEPLADLRETLQRSGYHCAQIKALRRNSDVGQREAYYQLIAERNTLVSAENLFDVISSCQALSVAYNVLYLSAIPDVKSLQSPSHRPMSLISNLLAKLSH